MKNIYHSTPRHYFAMFKVSLCTCVYKGSVLHYFSEIKIVMWLTTKQFSISLCESFTVMKTYSKKKKKKRKKKFAEITAYSIIWGF